MDFYNQTVIVTTNTTANKITPRVQNIRRKGGQAPCYELLITPNAIFQKSAGISP